jgi:hypothetical protein
MKAALFAFTALLLAGAIAMQPARGQVQVQPGPGFAVQIGPGPAPPPPSRSEEWREERLREGFYGSGSEEWREERLREELRARERCDRVLNPTARHRCFDDLR